MLCKKLFYFIVLVVINRALGQRCRGGAECVLLESCSGLFNNIQQGYRPNLLKVTGRLLCGFSESNKPKVCCPPVLQSQFQNPEPQSGISSRTGESSDPVSLLPDFTVCGIQEDNITTAQLTEHPWIALLRFDKPNGWGFYCGGVLISSKYVLTSASCVQDNNLPSTWNLTHVRLGEWNTSSSMDCDRGYCNMAPLDVPVEQIIVHEDFDPVDKNQYNDIALLRLGQGVQFSEFIRPICLPAIERLKISRFEGYDMEVAGWGETGSRAESDVKRIARMSTVDMPLCFNLFKRLGRQITTKQLCAREANGTAHRPNSGSSLMVNIPIFENWIAVGIMSDGRSLTGVPGWPSVYTHVSPYVDWITSQLRP